MAIAHRTGIGKKIVIGDKSLANADTIVKIMNDAGMEMDLSSRKSIVKLIAETQKHSEISATLFTLIRWLSAAMKSALWRRSLRDRGRGRERRGAAYVARGSVYHGF